MKNFEEFWNGVIDIPYDKEADSKDKAIARAFWKAALEWLMSDCCPEAWCVHDVEFDVALELGYAEEYLKAYDRRHGINEQNNN